MLGDDGSYQCGTVQVESRAAVYINDAADRSFARNGWGLSSRQGPLTAPMGGQCQQNISHRISNSILSEVWGGFPGDDPAAKGS